MVLYPVQEHEVHLMVLYPVQELKVHLRVSWLSYDRTRPRRTRNRQRDRSISEKLKFRNFTHKYVRDYNNRYLTVVTYP